MSMQAIHRWHQTKAGLAVFAVAELLLAYAAASWAIDSGSLLAYTLALVLLVGAVQNMYRLIRQAVKSA